MNKSSVIRGVHWDGSRECWRARIRKINFHRRYQTEMEAAAHYNAVAQKVWADRIDPHTGSSVFGTRLNAPRRGRPERSPKDENGRWVIHIDHEYSTVVDADIYLKAKDVHWFVRKRAFQAVLACRLIDEEPWVEFDYLKMHDWIAASKTGLQFDEIKGKVLHRDRHYLNNQFANLLVP